MCTSRSGFSRWERESPFSLNVFRVCWHAQTQLARLSIDVTHRLFTDLLSAPTRTGQLLRPNFSLAVASGGAGRDTKSVATIGRASKTTLASRQENKAMPVGTGDQEGSMAVPVPTPPGGWHNCVLYGLPHLTLVEVP